MSRTGSEDGTVIAYQRWGSGPGRDPGDAPPYETEREIEDIDALLAEIAQPTVVATGGSPDSHMAGLPSGFFDRAADAIAGGMPRAQRGVIAGQACVPEPKAVASVLERFFGR